MSCHTVWKRSCALKTTHPPADNDCSYGSAAYLQSILFSLFSGYTNLIPGSVLDTKTVLFFFFFDMSVIRQTIPTQSVRHGRYCQADLKKNKKNAPDAIASDIRNTIRIKKSGTCISAHLQKLNTTICQWFYLLILMCPTHVVSKIFKEIPSVFLVGVCEKIC